MTTEVKNSLKLNDTLLVNQNLRKLNFLVVRTGDPLPAFRWSSIPSSVRNISEVIDSSTYGWNILDYAKGATRFSVLSQPNWLTINTSTGDVSLASNYPPDVNENTEYTLSLRAFDADNNHIDNDITLTVLVDLRWLSLPSSITNISEVIDSSTYGWNILDYTRAATRFSVIAQPDWLTINTSNGDVSLASNYPPDITEDTEYTLSLRAFDANNNYIDNDIILTVLFVAFRWLPLPSSITNIPESTRTDDYGWNVLDYVRGGTSFSVLSKPDWIAIHSIESVFDVSLTNNYPPDVTENTEFTLSLRAFDANNNYVDNDITLTVVQDLFWLNFPDYNTRPDTLFAISFTVNEGEEFNSNFANYISRRDYDSITFDPALPSWITESGGYLTGTAPNNIPADIEYTMTATATEGDLSATSPEFTIYVFRQIRFTSPNNVEMYEGQSFSRILTDYIDHAEATITFHELPSWLIFDEGTKTISGTAPALSPPDYEVDYNVRWNASIVGNGPWASIGFNFSILVYNNFDWDDIPSSLLTVEEGTEFSLSNVSNYIQEDYAISGSYTITVEGVSWLSYDSTTDILSGTAPDVDSDTTVQFTLVGTADTTGDEDYLSNDRRTYSLSVTAV